MNNFQADKESLLEMKASYHTLARGAEDFDKVYGLGV